MRFAKISLSIDMTAAVMLFECARAAAVGMALSQSSEQRNYVS